MICECCRKQIEHAAPYWMRAKRAALLIRLRDILEAAPKRDTKSRSKKHANQNRREADKESLADAA
jgi:hypothetical protein